MAQATLAQNEEVILDIKDSARRRLICGLRWDPMTEGARDTLDRATMSRGGITSAHDLDLLCLIFDKSGQFMDGVTGEEDHRTGDFGNIYHTGDVIDGEDSLDDEQISLELFNLSSKIHQIIFIAEIQSAHNFGAINAPEIRIANAIDDRDFVHAHIGQGNGDDKNAYIFGSLCRRPQGWAFRYIGKYLEGEHVSDWVEVLNPYLETVATAEGDANTPAVPAKNQTVPLHYTKQARHRVVCGLNWDPAQNDGENFDLDLACVMFDENKEAVDGVSAKPDENIDSSGKVYHSGDDTSGEGDRVDDEAISVELRDLPDYIHHIVFLAEVQSHHTFDQIHNPALRIADGKTDDDQLLSKIGGPEGVGKNAYVFARISRHDGDWTLTYIDEFADGAQIDDWISYLGRYLG